MSIPASTTNTISDSKLSHEVLELLSKMETSPAKILDDMAEVLSLPPSSERATRRYS